MTLRLSRHPNRLLAVLAVVAVLSVATAPVDAQTSVSAPFSNLGNQTLVPNGDFENGLDGWTPFNALITFAPTTTDPLFDTTSVRGTISLPFAGPGGAIFRTVSGLTPGETYVLSAFINTANLHPLAQAYVDMADIFQDPQVSVPGGAPTTQFTYAPFIANDSSMTVRFVVDAVGQTVVPIGSFAFADNIAITPLASFIPVNSAASAAPEPGTLALLAVGSLLVLPAIGLARRRAV